MHLQILLVLKLAVFSMLNIVVCEILMHGNDVISTSFLLGYVSHAAFPKESNEMLITLMWILYV